MIKKQTQSQETVRVLSCKAMQGAKVPRQCVFHVAILAASASACILLLQSTAADSARTSSSDSLLGSFSTSDSYNKHNNISLHISVQREDGSYRLNFQGMGRALHGHAPEGGGRGKIVGRILRFQFEDSFFNRGTGTFRKLGDHYLLRIDISVVAEPSILSAYGDTPVYRD